VFEFYVKYRGERRERGTTLQRGGREGGRGMREGPLGSEGGLYLNICVGIPKFAVTPILMGPVCLLSQGRFEEERRGDERN